jgi:hypothetical protein
MVWYKNPKDKKGTIRYRRNTMDFGDAASTLIVRIIQKKAQWQDWRLHAIP